MMEKGACLQTKIIRSCIAITIGSTDKHWLLAAFIDVLSGVLLWVCLLYVKVGTDRDPEMLPLPEQAYCRCRFPGISIPVPIHAWPHRGKSSGTLKSKTRCVKGVTKPCVSAHTRTL